MGGLSDMPEDSSVVEANGVLARDPAMTARVDCDVHHTVPDISALFPYLPQRWSDYCVEHAVDTLASSFYPAGLDLSATPHAREGDGAPGSDPELLAAHVLRSDADIA